MERWHLLGVSLLALALCFLPSCGDSGASGDGGPRNVPFTPLPTATPVPKLCGNGVVDSAVGEQCDLPDTSACSAGQSCVCCLCLGDGEDLGDRTFTIARPRSAFLSTGLAGADISVDPWLTGPLVFHAGRPNPDAPPDVEIPDNNCPVAPGPLPAEASCSAELTLAQDGIFGFNDPIQGTFCAKFFAEGSTGFIDCDGGTAHNVDVSIDSMGAADEGPIMICANQGDPSSGGPGAATLSLMRTVSIRVPFNGVASRPAAEICPTLNYDNPFDPGQLEEFNINPADILDSPAVLTTARGTGIVLHPLGSANVQLSSVQAENFLCSRWTETDSPGGFITDLPGLDNPLAGGDTMNAFLLFDMNR